MSDLHEVDVFISPDGTVRVEIRGMKGKGCLSVTKKIEELLGGGVVDQVQTDEYHEQSDYDTDSDLLKQS